MNKTVYDYLADMEAGFQTIVDTSNLMKAKSESYQQEMKSYQDKIEKTKQKIQVINERQVIAELRDIFIATAKEWGVSPNDMVVNYATKWDKVVAFSELNKYEATKNANAFNAEKGQATNTMLLNFDIEYQENGVTKKKKRIPINMPMTFLQKDGKPFRSHITAKVFSSDNCVIQKLMIDDINQVLLTYQLRELVKLEGSQFVPCNDLAMNILDSSVLYDQRKASDPNMDF